MCGEMGSARGGWTRQWVTAGKVGGTQLEAQPVNLTEGSKTRTERERVKGMVARISGG